MCVRTIVDASAFGHFCAPTRNSAGDQLRRWIERGDGVIVYSAANNKYATELNKYTEARVQLRTYDERGRAIDIDPAHIEAAKDEIPDRAMRQSDDPHILALAVASKATVLFSCDHKLRKDFANSKVLRNVGLQHRRCVPDLLDNLPKDITKAPNRKKFLAQRRCSSSR